MTSVARPIAARQQLAATFTRTPTAFTRTGRILTAIPVLFLLFDATIKLLNIKAVSDAMAQLGFPANLTTDLAVLLLACLTLYLVPRTALLGAVLLTGYLGGAVATHVRVGDPLFFLHVLFPVYVGALLWGGLILRDATLRALIMSHPS